jgi:hypothetical protein
LDEAQATFSVWPSAWNAGATKENSRQIAHTGLFSHILISLVETPHYFTA